MCAATRTPALTRKGVYLRECDLALPVAQESERVEGVGGDAHLARVRVSARARVGVRLRVGVRVGAATLGVRVRARSMVGVKVRARAWVSLGRWAPRERPR